MARERVQVLGHVPRGAAEVWAVLRDFCGAWHPSVASIRAERDGRGALIRAFTVRGEEGIYREQLTWFSDSGRSLAYRHVEGIAGVERYDARVTVTAAERGCTVMWTADLTAPLGRVGAMPWRARKASRPRPENRPTGMPVGKMCNGVLTP